MMVGQYVPVPADHDAGTQTLLYEPSFGLVSPEELVEEIIPEEISEW
jgi:hypothetical protein